MVEKSRYMMQAKPDAGSHNLGHKADQAIGPSQPAQTVLWVGRSDFLIAFFFY